jgi:hypothetical protein
VKGYRTKLDWGFATMYAVSAIPLGHPGVPIYNACICIHYLMFYFILNSIRVKGVQEKPVQGHRLCLQADVYISY